MKLTTLSEAYEKVGNVGPGFDLLRLVAASAVVLHHSLRIEHDIIRDDLIFKFSDGYTQMGLLAVSVFFAISGFLVTPGLAKTGNVIGYFSRRFMRTMPLLVTIVVVAALVIGPIFTSLALVDYFSSPVTWSYLKMATTFLSPQLPGVTNYYEGGSGINTPIWTLHFEWMCYIVLGALSILGVLTRRWAFLALYLLALVAIFGVIGPIPADQERGKLFLFLFLFSYFGAGVLISLFGDLIPWSKWLLLAAFAALVAVYATPFDYVLAPFLTGYIVVGMGLLHFPKTPLTTGVDLSYGVYLSHSLIFLIVMNLYPIDSWLVLFAIGLPLSYLTAFATWKFVEEPAMAYKKLPEQWVRKVIARIVPQPAQGAR